MGGVVNKIPIVRDVVKIAGKITPGIKTTKFEKGKQDKDPNRLAYQWDVYDTHQKSRQARDLSEARGAFTGQITDYATLARDARAATDATGTDAQREALNRAKNRREALNAEIEGTRGAIAGMRADARRQMEQDMKDNVVDKIRGESAERRSQRLREKYSKEKDMNIFGTRSDIKMPGDPGYGEVQQQEEEKFKRPAYREFLEKIAAAKKGDFG